MQPLSFWTWFTSLNMMISSSIYLPENGIILLFFMDEWYCIVYIYYIFLIHSLVVEHLGCFQSFVIVNSAVINIGVRMTLLYPGLYSFGTSRSGQSSLDCRVVPFLGFWGLSMLLSVVVVLIYIPTNSG
jgi:hypothetical protein